MKTQAEYFIGGWPRVQCAYVPSHLFEKYNACTKIIAHFRQFVILFYVLLCCHILHGAFNIVLREIKLFDYYGP